MSHPPTAPRTNPGPPDVDTLVVGAGIGGLLAAITAAQQAPTSRVVVLEPHPPGGRGRCDRREGFTFNRGPRALYRNGEADRALRSVGVDTASGGPPILAGAAAIHGGAVHRFPGGPVESLRTTLLTGSEKAQVSRLLAALWRAGTDEPGTVAGWLDRQRATGTARAFVEALVRVSTYANAPEVFAAGPALRNARLGIRPGVRYLDGGWQSIVDALVEIATNAGVEVRSIGATRVEALAHGPVAVTIADGSQLLATSVIVATGGPEAAAGLLGATPPSWGVLGPPVTAACLELGVRTPPTRRFALGIDQPVYASTHCPPADLAPEGMAVVHLMRYQPIDDVVPSDAQHQELRAVAAAIGIEPNDILTERFLARMVVSGALPTAAGGGLDGRPAVAVAEHQGVFLCGDWVGPTGLLLDAVASSALAAGRQAAARSATMVPA